MSNQDITLNIIELMKPFLEPLSKKCQHCTFFTSDQTCMDDHVLIYHEGFFNEYLCNMCNCYYQTIEDLDMHIEQIHGDNVDEESEPELETKSKLKTKITKYEIEHKNEDNLSEDKSPCPICGEFFSPEDLDIHFKQTHKLKSKSKTHEKLTILCDEDDSEQYDSEQDDSEQDDNNLYKRSKCIKKTKVKKTIDDNYDSSESEDEITNDTNKKLSRWSTISGKYECQLCHYKFTSQSYLGEHFMENHYSYTEQLQLDNFLHNTSFVGYEVLIENNYCEFPLLDNYYGLTCEICQEEYLIEHDKKLRTINPSYLEMYEGCALYPIVIKCCINNHMCHKCLSEYLNQSYLNGLLYCAFCQQDKSRYDLEYLTLTEIKCDVDSWQNWWKEKDRVDLLAFNQSLFYS